MLKQLQIRNWALAENLSIEFQPNLNILTGETGAGKSILVGAIAAVLGGRAYTEVIRTGFEKAQVEAIYDISKLPKLRMFLDERGLEAGEELVIRREISQKSSSRAFVNDSAVTVATLAEIGNFLMDIHGQHEHQSLLRKETHRQFLDALGQLAPDLQNVETKYFQVREAEKKLKSLQSRQKELNEKRELYEFQFNEIRKSNLVAGEEEALEDERRLLSNVEKLNELSAQLSDLFSGENVNLLDGVGQAENHLAELSRYATELQRLFEEFKSARIVLDETARSIEEFQNKLEFDPQRLEEVESRLDLISKLKKKYGNSIQEILDYQKELEDALNLQGNFELEIRKLEKEYQQAVSEYCNAAQHLSEKRTTIAAVMEKRVAEQLTVLGMTAMRFQVSISKTPDKNGLFREKEQHFFADEFGVDQIEFFISPNPGEEFKPLMKIASGGEMSRIMLALKTILAETDEIPSLIFDEIDTGVSGRVAQSVGRSIANLAKSHQILCITHLPQIAAQGNSHFSVEKFVSDGRTYTQILPLDESGKVEAVARLIAGNTITDTVIESARQLIAEGRQN
ncbi:MAG: DNA repair protein RecN [Calditrichae bacterium]|nr:DNA repair protein RecN [Calditrichia bacterium]